MPESAFRSPLAPGANAGTVAVVTGGGTGIGRATARELARTGARTVICGRRPEPLDQTRTEIEAAGGECLAVPLDLREEDAAARLAGAALDRFGAVDVLVNNAGGQFAAPAEEITPRGWRAVQRLAVDAAWALTREVAERSMIPRRRGAIFFIGFSPRRGTPGMAHAAAARAAVENLAGSLACEWSRYNVRAVHLAVGTVRTGGLDRYGADQVERWERAVPLGRLGSPEEVAAVIAFLASPGGAYVTGTTVCVDGGLDAWGQGGDPPAPAP